MEKFEQRLLRHKEELQRSGPETASLTNSSAADSDTAPYAPGSGTPIEHLSPAHRQQTMAKQLWVNTKRGSGPPKHQA